MPVPNVAVPSRNVTVPLGVPVAVDVTVAVRVTAVPRTDGLFDEATEVAVVAALIV